MGDVSGTDQGFLPPHGTKDPDLPRHGRDGPERDDFRRGMPWHGNRPIIHMAHAEEVSNVETVTVVLNVLEEHVEAFEAGFREHELPVWQDLKGRGLLVAATLNRMEISSRPVSGAVQYLICAIFSTGEGHHAHDANPGFEAWNKIADGYQTGDSLAFGGETVVKLGIESA